MTIVGTESEARVERQARPARASRGDRLWWLAVPAALTFIVFFVIPVASLFGLSINKSVAGVIGLSSDFTLDNFVRVFTRATYYRRLNDQPLLSRGFFVGGTLEAGNTWLSRRDINIKDLRYASSVFLGSDTGLGPLYVGIGYAPRGGTALYVFIGRP